MIERIAEALLILGFRDIGRWTVTPGGRSLEYLLDGVDPQADDALLDARNALYAFVIGDEVKYIGKTARTLRERFVGYQNPHASQRTNIRNNRNIRDALAGGAEVRVLAFSPISHLRYRDFKINLAAGLEDELIATFGPPWNGRDKGLSITEGAEREEQDEPIEMAAEEARRYVVPNSAPSKAYEAGGVPFKIVLGEAYYHQGLINPGVGASAYLGEDGEPVEVIFDDDAKPVHARIDRRANRNGSVRVLGRNHEIASWFQARFRKGDTVDAKVLDSHRILLLSR